MAHHRRISSVTQAMHSLSTTKPHDESPVLSASGVSIVAVVTAAATVLAPIASALPSMRSSMSLDSDDDSMSMSSLDLLTPSTPGTPSKFYPHPPRFLASPNAAAPRAALTRAQFSLRRFVSRFLATLSPTAPGLPVKSPQLSPSSSYSYLVSLPTRPHAPLRRRATFLALLALIALSAWTLFTSSLGDRESNTRPYTKSVMHGWKDWRNKAQQREAEAHKAFLQSTSFRAAALSASPNAHSSANAVSPSSMLELTPADELAALTAFMAALPWNALPSHIDPTVPLDPTVILDFDPFHSRARSELAELRRETWQLNPVVLFGKSRHAPTREVRSALEKLGVNTKELLQVDMNERVDGDLVMGVLGRLVSSLASSTDKLAELDLPLLLIGGRPIRDADVPTLVENGELARLLRDAGVRLEVAGKKKKGH